MSKRYIFCDARMFFDKNKLLTCSLQSFQKFITKGIPGTLTATRIPGEYVAWRKKNWSSLMTFNNLWFTTSTIWVVVTSRSHWYEYTSEKSMIMVFAYTKLSFFSATEFADGYLMNTANMTGGKCRTEKCLFLYSLLFRWQFLSDVQQTWEFAWNVKPQPVHHTFYADVHRLTNWWWWEYSLCFFLMKPKMCKLKL